MKICIYGAGAIGSLLAGSLAQVGGVEVSMIARGEQLRAIRRDGLEVVKASESFRSVVRVTEDPTELGPQHYVFIALKSQQVSQILVPLQSLMDRDTVVIPPTTTMPYWYFHGLAGPYEGLQVEALDPEARLWRAMPPERVLGCAYRVAAEVLRPGVVRQNGSYARLPIGEPGGVVSERANRLSGALGAAGFEAPVVSDIRGWIWQKMTSSLCWNPLAALTLATWGQLAAQPQVLAIVRRMMDEADAIAARLGSAPPLSIEERLAAPGSAPGHKMSMLQDLERGRPLEFEAILGSLKAMSAVAGLQTPTTDEVYALIGLREASRALQASSTTIQG